MQAEAAASATWAIRVASHAPYCGRRVRGKLRAHDEAADGVQAQQQREQGGGAYRGRPPPWPAWLTHRRWRMGAAAERWMGWTGGGASVRIESNAGRRSRPALSCGSRGAIQVVSGRASIYASHRGRPARHRKVYACRWISASKPVEPAAAGIELIALVGLFVARVRARSAQARGRRSVGAVGPPFRFDSKRRKSNHRCSAIAIVFY